MPTRRKTDEIPEPTLADLVAANDLAGIEKMIADASSGIGDRDLVARISELEAELEAKAAEARRLNPLADWPVYRTPDDVIAHLGEDRLMEAAMEEVRRQNQDAHRKSRAPIFTTAAEQEEKARVLLPKLAHALIDEQSKWTKGDMRNQPMRTRTFKMIAPQRTCDRHDLPVVNCYEHGSMRQIPVELQINNGAASLNDPIERYKRKGFKPAAPIRCKLVDCYRPAAVSDGGQWRYNMYCSAEHHDYVEGGDRRQDRLGHEHDIVLRDVPVGR